MSDGVEIELPSAAMEQLAKVFGSDEKKPNGSAEFFDEDEGQLDEAVATKRLVGHIVLRGFDDEVVGSIPDEMKFRIQATKLPSRVRIIIDVKT